MLELNSWFFVLMGLFIVFYITLDRLLFTPMLDVFQKRQEAIDGSIAQAGEMQSERQEKLDEFKAGMSDASRKARGLFEDLRSEGIKRQKELVDTASKEAQTLIEKAREELRRESVRAKSELRRDADVYSDNIVDKLLKV